MYRYALIAFAAFAVLLVGASLPAQAQGNNQQVQAAFQRFSQYKQSEPYRTVVRQAIEKMEQSLGASCMDIEVKGQRGMPVKPIKFPSGSAHPTEGAWLERFSVIRCGTPYIFTFLFRAKPSGVPEFLVMVPGETQVQLPDQAKGVATAVAKAVQGVQGCTQGTVLNTKIVREVTPITFNDKKIPTGGAWEELWVVNACGTRRDVTLTISINPDASVSIK